MSDISEHSSRKKTRFAWSGATALLLATLICLLTACMALADGRYSSLVTSVKPAVGGVQVSVLGSDNQMRLANRSTVPVTVFGYQGDAVGRVLPDGTVQVNRASPSYWINQERMGGTAIPSDASVKAAPRWTTVNRTGVLMWHDHRMHWMGASPPPIVKDSGKRTRIFNYSVPITVGSTPGRVTGTLWWVGDGGGAPGWAIPALVILVIAGGLLVLLVRRRRAAEEQSR